MAKVYYIPKEPTEQFGYSFKPGKPVDVTNEHHLEVFKGNRFFSVGKEPPKTEPEDEGKAELAEDGADQEASERPIETLKPSK